MISDCGMMRLVEWVSNFDIDHLKNFLASLGAWAPLVFISFYVLAAIFWLPGSVLCFCSGALFGTVKGFLLVVIASNCGANTVFWLARRLGKEKVSHFLKRKFPSLHYRMDQNGFEVIFALRLLLVAPYSGVSYAAGVSPIAWKDFALGTVLGMLPASFVYTTLGSAVGQVSFRDPKTWVTPRVWVPFVFAIFFACLVKALKKRWSAAPKLDQ
jgi:uncharacterized membrane protein YdjX (TVP38/TMEM64 family)